MTSLKLLGIGAALALAMISNGHAQNTVDWGKTTCEELMRGTHEEAIVTGAWLSGYFHGLQKSTIVDVKQLSQNTELVLGYCSEHPKDTIMNAVGAVASLKK